MSNKELLPCPFCGGEADIEGSEHHYIYCKNCFADTRTYGSKAEAIKAWNTRNYSEIPNSAKDKIPKVVKIPEVVGTSNCEYLPEECCKQPCKDLPSWYHSEWNHQVNFSTCIISISLSVYLVFTVRRANNDLNTDKWEAYSELVNCVHDTQLFEEQIIFGVSRKEAIEKCDEVIRQMSNGFRELYNKNRKVEL